MRSSEPALWEESCRAALRESDPELLKQRVLDAEAALFRRALQLNGSPDDEEERAAMDQAGADLLVIKVRKLGWPSPFPLKKIPGHPKRIRPSDFVSILATERPEVVELVAAPEFFWNSKNSTRTPAQP